MAKKYLETHALDVVEQGYDICFIRPGEKRPWGKDWEAKTFGPKAITNAIDEGRSNFGVGIKTAYTPGVDIDCYDEDLVEHMTRYTEKLVGPALHRVGLAPKRLLVYRTRKPFPKTQSKVFIDDQGRPVKLEVLADGQQFVAYHIHPDTEKPYKWIGNTPLDVPADDLEKIDREMSQEIVGEFERQARKRGWKEKSTIQRLEGSTGKYHLDDVFISDKPKVDLAPEELLKLLHRVPGAEDYDTWFQIGMALFHQFDGGEEGLLMWHEWSANAHNYDPDVLDEKWPTFNVEGKKREPVTARIIIKQAKKEEERLAGEELDEIKIQISQAKNPAALQEVIDRVKTVAFVPLLRESLAASIREQSKRALGHPMPISQVRKAISFENPEHRAKPAWLRDWVFVQQDDTFYNVGTRQTLSTKGFDMTYARFMITKKEVLEGNTKPENSASDVAMNRYQIPTVSNRMYAPLEEDFFDANGLAYANSYSAANLPFTPETLTKKERQIVERLPGHVKHLFEDEGDGRMFLSWLAAIVQTNAHINWAPIIQGVENDGKSFFGRVMVGVLGGDNINMINGSDLVEKYTSWAEGSQFCLIEEVRLRGQDRFAIVNKVKPYISNDMVSVRRMNTDTYKVINTVNYLLTTNYKDGVPVNDSSSRYFPMFSRFQHKSELDAFNRKHPRYYEELHEILQHPGAMRRWLLDYEIDPRFDAVQRAPRSSYMDEMLFLNQDDDDEAFDEIIAAETAPDLSAELLNITKLVDVMLDRGESMPYGIALKRFLSDKGFTHLGRLTIDGRKVAFWSRRPSLFMKGRKVDMAKVKDWMDPI